MINHIIWAIIIIFILINIAVRVGEYFQSRKKQKLQQKMETMRHKNTALQNEEPPKKSEMTIDQMLRQKILKNYNVYMPPENFINSYGCHNKDLINKLNDVLANINLDFSKITFEHKIDTILSNINTYNLQK